MTLNERIENLLKNATGFPVAQDQLQTKRIFRSSCFRQRITII